MAIISIMMILMVGVIVFGGRHEMTKMLMQIVVSKAV